MKKRDNCLTGLFFLYYNQNHAGDTYYFREEKEYCYG